MSAQLVSTHHLHPIVDHFTIALLTFGIAAEILGAAAILLSWSRASVLSGWGQGCARRMDDVSTFAEVR